MPVPGIFGFESESTTAIIGIPALCASLKGCSRPEIPIAKIRLGSERRLLINCCVRSVVDVGAAFSGVS
jgi:hypothetical protein|tara:strand:+ start:153 stop:359 length:207 start_codon:yes stop_codon:yes gene_type:complete